MRAMLLFAFLVMVCQGRYFIDVFNNGGTGARQNTINAYPIDSCSLYRLSPQQWVRYTCGLGRDNVTRRIYNDAACTLPTGSVSTYQQGRPFDNDNNFLVPDVGIPMFDCASPDNWFSVGIWTGTGSNVCSASGTAIFYEFKMVNNVCFPNSYNALGVSNGQQRDREENGNWVMGTYTGCSEVAPSNPMGVSGGSATIDFFSDNACSVKTQTAMTAAGCSNVPFVWTNPRTQQQSPYFNLEWWSGSRTVGGQPDPAASNYYLQFGRCGRGDNPVIPPQGAPSTLRPQRNQWSQPIANVGQNEGYPELNSASTKVMFAAFVVTILSMLHL